MTTLRVALLLSLLAAFPNTGEAEDRHTLFTALLSKHVQDGWVDYQSLKSDIRLGEYLEQLQTTNPDRLPTDEDRLAYWINAYNAYTLKVIVDNYPVKSINDLHGGGLVLGSIFNTSIWDKRIAKINGRERSLNWIEHKVIRAQFKDPRAHFALVCASRSCPELRSEAYEGSRLYFTLSMSA